MLVGWAALRAAYLTYLCAQADRGRAEAKADSSAVLAGGAARRRASGWRASAASSLCARRVGLRPSQMPLLVG